MTVATKPAYVPVGPTGSLVYSEDFSGAKGSPPNPASWAPLTGGAGWGNNELESYTARSSNLQQDGSGHLALTAQKETYKGSDGIVRQYTSARIVGKQSFQYGWLEARIYLPQGQGLWPAFWTVGSDIYAKGWPACGEIDVMESANTMPGVLASVHGPTTSGSAYAMSNGMVVPGGIAGGWHTFSIDWRPDSIRWYVDGFLYNTVTKASLAPGSIWAFNKPQLVQLNLAVGGNYIGAPNSSTAFPATMLVDYVRLYR